MITGALDLPEVGGRHNHLAGLATHGPADLLHRPGGGGESRWLPYRLFTVIAALVLFGVYKLVKDPAYALLVSYHLPTDVFAAFSYAVATPAIAFLPSHFKSLCAKLYSWTGFNYFQRAVGAINKLRPYLPKAVAGIVILSGVAHACLSLIHI